MRRPQKTCSICESGVRVVDFKDERTLSRFLSERGKILPSRLSGTCRGTSASSAPPSSGRACWPSCPT